MLKLADRGSHLYVHCDSYSDKALAKPYETTLTPDYKLSTVDTVNLVAPESLGNMTSSTYT